MRLNLRTPPSLRRHKPSSLGVVTLNGKDHYLGHRPKGQNTPPKAVSLAYDQLVAEWLAAGRQSPPAAVERPLSISVNELLVTFWRHAEHRLDHLSLGIVRNGGL